MNEQAAQIEDENMPPLEEAELNSDPIEEPKPETAEAPKVESAPTEDVNVDEPKEQDPVQKRINKITADKYAEKRRADDLEAQLKALQDQPKPAEKKPELEDFDFDEAKFQEALIDHRVNLKAQELQQQQTVSQEQQQQATNQANFNVREAEYAAKNPDYMESVSNLPQLPPDVYELITQTEDGPQLAHYLSKHLDVADEIINSPLRQMKLGQISAQLSGSKPDKQTSAAPEPIEPITSSGSLDKNAEDMSMEEIYNMG